MTHADRIAWVQGHTPAENNVAWWLAQQAFQAMPPPLRHPGATVLLELAMIRIDHAKERTRRPA